MKKRILLAILASVSLLSTMFGSRLIVPADASTNHHPAQSIWVEPSFIDNLLKDYTFTIKVMVNITDPPGEGTGLFGWEYRLKWNSTVLDPKGCTVDIPPEWGIRWSIRRRESGHYPNCTDYHRLGVSAITPAPAVTGLRSMCTYNFRVIYQPDYNGTLDLHQTKLFDDTGVQIPHTTYDGEYRMYTKPVPTNPHPAQSIWVDPEFIDDLQKYDMFTIDVIVNITDPPGPAIGTLGWDYKLKWNSTCLNLVSYTVNFPPEWGDGWFKPKDEIGHYPDCTDYHWLSVSSIGPRPPVTGLRSLCTYNFRVIYQPYYPEPDYNGTLDLQDTKLADDMGEPIPHTTYDGEYRIPALLLSPDINLDGIVDILDVVLAAVAFGSRPGDPNWNRYADLNADDLIDIFDMVIIGINYGKTG